jgi:hypothetical protein
MLFQALKLYKSVKIFSKTLSTNIKKVSSKVLALLKKDLKHLIMNGFLEVFLNVYKFLLPENFF